MKTKFLLLLLFIVFVSQLFSQQFYYSSKKKIFLIEDTSTLVIKLKDPMSALAVSLKLTSVLFEKIDTTKYKGIIEAKLKSGISKKNALSVIRQYPEVFFAWHSLISNNFFLIPTGEILLLPAKGVSLDSILLNTKVADKVQMISTDKYGVSTLSIKNKDSLFSIANLLYESNMVNWCHPNFWAPLRHATNDPLYSDQWYLKNTGQFSGTSGIDINIEGAWAVTTGSSSIKIAVIDMGVDDHEDIAGRVLSGYTATNSSAYGSASGSHGEACAGIIAATRNNLIGIAGIASNCYIVPVDIFAGNASAQQVANAINWAWDNGSADVLSNSWSYGSPADAITQAIGNARIYGRGGKGSIVVFSSGNDYGSVAYPGNIDGVITVGAIDNNGSLWSYSNTGASMDLVAPSSDGITAGIRTTDRMGSAGYTSGNYTTSFNGTSAACPQVSGVAALVLSVNPNLTEAQVRTLLQNTATDMGAPGFDNSYGYGRVNAEAAVCQASSTGFIITSSNSDNAVCTLANYSINVVTGTSVDWSIDAPSIASINPITGSSTTLTKIADGRVTLKATISGGCSVGGTVVTKKIGVGIPDLAQRFPRQNPRIAPIQYGYYNYATLYKIYTDPMPGSYQTWTASTDDPYFSWGFGADNILWFYFSNVNYTTTFYGTETNACGSSSGYIYCKSVLSGGSGGGTPLSLLAAPEHFTFSPNPTTGIAGIKSINNLPFTQIRIFDKMGNLRKHLTYPSNTTSATINVSSLAADIYSVQVLFGSFTSSKHFIKQ